MFSSWVEKSGFHLLRDAWPEIRNCAEQGCRNDAAPQKYVLHVIWFSDAILWFHFLGGSLRSSGSCPSLCTENASVRMPPRHWYWLPVSYPSVVLRPVQLTPARPVVIAWMPFTDIGSHHWLRHSAAKYWPLRGGFITFHSTVTLFSGS